MADVRKDRDVRDGVLNHGDAGDRSREGVGWV